MDSLRDIRKRVIVIILRLLPLLRSEGSGIRIGNSRVEDLKFGIQSDM